jgi:coenzyme F420-0:L-glutamate ligase/coenzyme F420-1:gamma-L-glutamate ligase
VTQYKTLELIALIDLPIIQNGDKLSEIIINNARRHNTTIFNKDIFIITQKIISKSENRMVDLRCVTPTDVAIKISRISEKDPRLVQLILEESKEIMRVRKGLIIVRHKLGFVCANAGIDHSNTVPGDEADNFVLLLPEDPDKSARKIKQELEEATGKTLGIMIIDSHGRAWRNGTVGTTIGMAGIPGLVDLRGKPDLFGYTLKATQVAAADELAAAASLLMGQADESIPCVLARGFPYALRDSSLSELIRYEENDLFK